MTAPLTFTLPAELVEQIARRVAEIMLEREPAKAAEQRWLTVAEAAAYIGAKPQRIYDLRSSGRLSRTGDGSRGLVDRRELDEMVEATPYDGFDSSKRPGGAGTPRARHEE